MAQRERPAAAGGDRRRVGAPGRRGSLRAATTPSHCCSSAAIRPCPPPSQLALTLRAVGGSDHGEIAHAFLVPEATMAQRISRAKQRASRAPVCVRPAAGDRTGRRLRVVLQVLYLVFNEGYTTSSGPVLQRADLTTEAIRLTRLLHRLAPDEGEVAGLLALMLLTDARRAARTNATARSCRSPNSDVISGTPRRSPRASSSSPARSGASRSARISCRRRSPPCMTRRRATRRPTGRRSWRCTTCSSTSRPVRS